MKTGFLILAFLAGAVSLSSDAIADRRSYAWTYEYKTVGRGEAELESYLTLSAAEIDSLEGNVSAEHQIELEVGMTDRFDFSIYQVFEQGPGEEESFRYKGFKLRSRYRLAEGGQRPLDTLLYLEYKGVPDFSENTIEAKVILAKDIGKINFAINPILEFEHEDEWETETEYAAGVSYGASETLRLGVEAKGGEHGHYLGPVVSHGVGDLWVTLGSAFGISDITGGKPEFQLRMLLGVGL